MLYQHPRVDAKIGGQQFFKYFLQDTYQLLKKQHLQWRRTCLPDTQRTAHSLFRILTQKAAPSLNHEDATNPAGNTLISALKPRPSRVKVTRHRKNPETVTGWEETKEPRSLNAMWSTTGLHPGSEKMTLM